MEQQPIITSHRSRVKRAEEYRKKSPERISIFDREAFVEFFLLEDVLKLYEYRLSKLTNKTAETRSGIMAQQKNIEKYINIINLFKSIIEIAEGQIYDGNYKAVWQSIPEHPLMVAAGSIKHLPELRAIATKMLRDLYDETIKVIEQNALLEESLDEIESHDRNYRTIKDLPKADDIENLIKAAEIAIPNVATKTKSRINPNY